MVVLIGLAARNGIRIVHFVSEKHEHARSGDGGRASVFPAAMITLFAR
jgi:hypothetical protein